MELVAFVGSDKETWGQVNGLINRGEWDKVILVKNGGAGGYPTHANSEVISIDGNKPLLELRDEIKDKLKGKLGEMEVALSIASGSGKEHMAIIAALLSMPVGVRLVVFTKTGVEFVN